MNQRSNQELNKISIFAVCFIMLFLSFHYSAYAVLHFNGKIVAFFCLLAFLFALYANGRYLRKPRLGIGLWLIVLLISFINNGYVKNNQPSKWVPFTTMILIVYFLCFKTDWIEAFKKCILIFTFEHMILSWIFWINRGFYLSNVITRFPENNRKILIRYSKQNVLMGLTNHFSSSGIYFSIGFILFFSLYLSAGKSRKYLLLSIFTYVCLIMTQKRAPLIFVTIAAAFTYFAVNKKTSKTYLRFVAILIGTLLLFLFASRYVPAVKNALLRFETIINEDGSVNSNGRYTIYQSAYVFFKKNWVTGIGWAQFRFENYREISVHNVYLQLLTECGLFGGLFVIFVIFYSLKRSYDEVKLYSGEMKGDSFPIIFSLFLQIFFALYSITGNPLYDQQVFTPYIFAVGMTYSFRPRKTGIPKADPEKGVI